jgi:hypothetical protein
MVVGGTGYLLVKQSRNHQVVEEEKQQEPENDNIQPDEPQETSGEGIYSIMIESSPSINAIASNASEMSLSIRLKNLSIIPFITNLGGENCTLTDLKGRQYPAQFMSENSFKKAILPGEESLIDIVRQPLYVSLVQKGEVACDNPNDGISNGIKCVYDESGECACENLGVLKVSDCVFRISTDGKQASNGWGKYPLMVSIEK